MSQKHKLGECSKSIITERQINPDEYLARINRIAGQEAFVVHKMRKSFIWAKQYFELDSLLEPQEGIHLLEVTTEVGAEIKLPPFLQLVQDVSELPEYERL